LRKHKIDVMLHIILLSQNMHETHVQLGYKVCDILCKTASPVTAV